MADKFSAQWWADQAAARGGRLTQADIEALAGVAIKTIPQPGREASGAILPWYLRVRDLAPGWPRTGVFVIAGEPGDVGLTGSELAERHADNPAGIASDPALPSWPPWVYYQSQVGFSAPGATAPYQPTLSTAAPAPVVTPQPTPTPAPVVTPRPTPTPTPAPAAAPIASSSSGAALDDAPAVVLALAGEPAEVLPPANLGPTEQAPPGSQAERATPDPLEQLQAVARKVPGWVWALLAVVLVVLALREAR